MNNNINSFIELKEYRIIDLYNYLKENLNKKNIISLEFSINDQMSNIYIKTINEKQYNKLKDLIKKYKYNQYIFNDESYKLISFKYNININNKYKLTYNTLDNEYCLYYDKYKNGIYLTLFNLEKRYDVFDKLKYENNIILEYIYNKHKEIINNKNVYRELEKELDNLFLEKFNI